MLTFCTPGHLQLEALSTFGLTSKNESQIGRFGTGLKYGTAVILANQGTMRIISDSGESIVGREPAEFRGKPVLYATLNGQRLSFTTELGRDWKPWMAFREFYANTLDEGGFFVRGSAERRAGWTHIEIDCPALEAVHDNFEEHFIDPDEQPICRVGDLEIYRGESSQIFYRGFAVYSLPKGQKASFRYNITSHLALTEDRTAASAWEIFGQLEFHLADLQHEEVLAKVLHRDSFEAALNFGGAPSPAFVGVTQKLGNDASPAALLASAKAEYKSRSKDPSILSEASKSNHHLMQAIAMLRIIGAPLEGVRFGMLPIPHGAPFESRAADKTIIINEDAREDAEQCLQRVFAAFAQMHPNFFRDRAVRLAKEIAMKEQAR
jgi:hypothetical protein